MAEEVKSDSTEWWIWLVGGLLLLGLAGNAGQNWPGNNNNETVVESEVVISDGDGEIEIATNTQTEEGGLFSIFSGSERPSEKLAEALREAIVNFSVFEAFPGYTAFSFIVSFLALFVLLYSNFRYSWILEKWNEEINYHGNKEEKHRSVDYPTDPLISPEPEVFTPKNERWEHITELVASDNQSDWRQAILEADILLEELLAHIGYQGLTLADKLKQVDPADMSTLSEAWEAHKIRNRIAHEGSNYEISRPEFVEVISKYEKVFNEFHFI